MKRKLYILIFVVCLILLVVWYVHPIHVKKEMNVCSLDGKTAEIEVNIYFYRNFFKGNAVRGTIEWNGVKYLDQHSKWGKEPYSDDNFLQNNEDLPEMTFLNAELSLVESTLNRIMFIDSRGGYDLKMLDIIYHDGVMDENGVSTGVEYFGPANSQEEAQKIYQEFYGNYN